ncbi:NADPH:quinone oxidoreductase family protein [Euzebya tangerina]|uniref:NADPH:quinone oxidoreductase family protein n=1 Tax=Euzebya tangerina TaxID=591198 RepID=UPI000E30CB40|nr:NADPH:quinone oxidoreductase family protein [Euzebya tangerina]
MRAIHITSLDGPSAVDVVDIPAPEPTGDQVLIDVRAAGVAFPDLLQTRGLYQLKPEMPFVPGVEVAGVIRSAPSDSGFSEGDRVMAFGMLGGMAEQLAVSSSSTFALPDELSFEQGAAFPMNYHTAHFSLVRRGQLQSGETVLVHGAAGGVGTATIQVAKALGARVIAVVSTDEKAAVAREAGADDVIRSDGPWKDEAKALTDGRGVDVIMDPVGGDRFTDSIRALAPEGRLLVVGFAAGSIPEVRVNRLLLSNTTLVGCAWGGFLMQEPAIVHDIGDALDAMIREGALAPPIGAALPLERAAEALTLLDERKATGKVVLTVGAD